MSTKSQDNYCCNLYPLLDIELDHVIVDELHFLLRITDVLTSNLVDEVLTWDQDDFQKTHQEIKGKHLKKLIETIRSCGVSFEVMEKKVEHMTIPVYLVQTKNVCLLNFLIN
jgi:hypothetical protein